MGGQVSVSRTHIRKARKPHSCGACNGKIQADDQYLEHVASPGWADIDPRHWMRFKECVECAIRYGRRVENMILKDADS
jgi:hypothetical protein